MRRLALAIALGLGWMASSAGAADSPRDSTVANAPAKNGALGKASAPAKARAAKATTAPAKAGAKAGAKTGAKTAPRQLQDIHIEGEIPVPQVLFITARDQRRFMDFQHRRYLRTSLEVGEQTIFPTKIAVIGNRPAGERKETSP
jgi:hypothetical protein